MPYSKKTYGTMEQFLKFKHCVKELEIVGRVKSPHAVCRSSIYGKKKGGLKI